jgi:hypothetical protein
MFLKIDSQGLDPPTEPPINSTDLLSVLSNVGNGAFTSDQVVPANVLYYGASRVNLLKIWQHLSALISVSSYPLQIEQFNSWVTRIKDAFQIDLEKELFMAIDQEIAFACYAGEFRRRSARNPPSLEDFPCFVLFKVNDKETLEHTLQKIVTSLQIESPKEIYKNTEIQSLTIPGQIAPFTVYTAFVKDFLLVSVSRAMLQEIITVSQQGRSLATAEDYYELSLHFPTRGYSKGYINIKKLSELVRRLLNKGDQAQPSFQNDKTALALDLIAFAEQLPGMIWMTTVVSDGFLTESFSPVGGTVAGIALTWFGLSLVE